MPLLSKHYLFGIFLSDMVLIGPTQLLTGTADILSNCTLAVIDAAFGTFVGYLVASSHIESRLK